MAKSKKIGRTSAVGEPDYGPLSRPFDWRTEDSGLADRLASAIGRVSSDDWRGGRALPKASGDGAHIYFDIDRYARHDHGGGDDGDGWMSGSQIDDQYDTANKEHGSRIAAVKSLLAAEGFDDSRVEFEIGEKGHVSIEIDLRKLFDKEILTMRARVADGSASSAQLAKMAEIEEDAELLGRIATAENARLTTLSSLFAKNKSRIDRGLASNGRTPKETLVKIWKRYRDVGRDDQSIKVILTLAANGAIPPTVLAAIEKTYPKDETVRAALVSNPAWDADAKAAFFVAGPVGAADIVAKLPFSSPAALLLAVGHLVAAVKDGKAKTTDWNYLRALRAIAGHPAADDDVIRAALAAPSSGETRMSIIASAGASRASSSGLLAELADELASTSEPADAALKAVILNPATPTDKLVKMNEAFVKTSRHHGSRRWLGGEVGECLARRLGFIDSAEAARAVGKKGKDAAESLIQKITAIPTGALVEMTKQVRDLPDSVVAAVLSRFESDVPYRDGIYADVVLYLARQEKISNQTLTKLTELIARLNKARNGIYADQEATKDNAAVLAVRFDVAGILASGNGVFSKGVKDKIEFAMRHGGPDVYAAVLGSDKLPEKLASYVFKNAKELGATKLLYAILGANPSTPSDILASIGEMSDYDVNGSHRDRNPAHAAVGANPSTPASTLKDLSASRDVGVRAAVAGNKRTPREVLKKLVDDRESWVRQIAAETLVGSR